MLVDYHVHTAYSDDSDYEMERVVQDAIRLGLDEICFTDHVDYGIKSDWTDAVPAVLRAGAPGELAQMPLMNVDYPRYFEEFARLKARYAGQIALKLGLEFGMQTHTVPQYEALFARYPFDCILLSVHEVEDKEFWTQDFQRGRTQKEYNERYYEEILRLVQSYHHYSVLAHLDLIARYDTAGPYPFAAVRPLVTEILRTAIADGKGIEINTSSRRYGLPDLTPSRDILRFYKEMGGEIITIGSDSHKPEHLGADALLAQKQLRELGFTRFCTFEKMRPIFHELAE